MIPSWRETQIRQHCEPLRTLTHAHACDLLQRVHRRVDSLRFQLWSTMKELEELQVRLSMGNPNLPPIHKTKPSAWHPAKLFSRKETKNARIP